MSRIAAMQSREVYSDHSNEQTTPELIKDFVAAVTLPPNFKITYEEPLLGFGAYVVIAASWPDLDGGRDNVGTYTRMPVEKFKYLPFHVFVDTIYHEASKLWMHEFHEQFRVDDRFIVHPHPEGRRGPLG